MGTSAVVSRAKGRAFPSSSTWDPDQRAHQGPVVWAVRKGSAPTSTETGNPTEQLQWKPGRHGAGRPWEGVTAGARWGQEPVLLLQLHFVCVFVGCLEVRSIPFTPNDTHTPPPPPPSHHLCELWRHFLTIPGLPPHQ